MSREDSGGIYVDLTRDEESQNWMSEKPDERKTLKELSDTELEEKTQKIRDKHKSLYIEQVKDYLIEKTPEEYIERRGVPGFIIEAAIAVDNVDITSCDEILSLETAESILQDQNYEIAE